MWKAAQRVALCGVKNYKIILRCVYLVETIAYLRASGRYTCWNKICNVKKTTGGSTHLPQQHPF